MRGDSRLRVVVGDHCSLCDTALARLMSAGRIVGVGVTTETLDEGDNRDRFATRVPVVLDRRRGVIAEGRIGTLDAWRAVLRCRFGWTTRTDRDP